MHKGENVEIRITYIGLTKDGVKWIWCGFKPEDVTVNEEIPILYPELGKVLKDKTAENYSHLLFLKMKQTNIIMKK